METNNLLGKGHRQYVQDQIKMRQEKLGKTIKDNQELSWMNSKTSWVRLVSGVDIENQLIQIPKDFQTVYENAEYKAGGDTTSSENISPNLNKTAGFILGQLVDQGFFYETVELPTGEQRLKLIGFPDKTFYGNNLAAQGMLMGGMVGVDKDGIKLREGIAPQSFPAYRNSSKYGFTPMPGITSFSSKSKSMGSLNEAQLTIKVNDAFQLAIIDALYLRLGYTMFLEWGNSLYFKNDGTYTKGSSTDPYLFAEFLAQDVPSQEEIEAVRTTKMRDIDGDGVEEKLTEEQLAEFEKRVSALEIFHQKIQKEKERSCGNYDAILGKVSNFDWEFNTDGTYTVNLTIISWGDIIESLKINTYYPDIQLEITDDGEVDVSGVERKDRSALEAFIYEAAQPNMLIYSRNYLLYVSNLLQYEPVKRTLVSEFKTDIKFFWVNSPLNAAQQSASEYHEGLNYDRGATNSAGKVISGFCQMGEEHQYSYIRFGDILDFIKTRLLLYTSGGEPIIDIDTRPATSFCYDPEINVSANPSKVMIRRTIPYFNPEVFTSEDRYKWMYWTEKYPETKKTGIWEEVFNNGTTIYSATLEPFSTPIPGINGVVGGDIMNIYFEQEYLYSEIDALLDKNTGAVVLLDFIKNLLTTANDCLGGVNKLDVRITDDRVIQIYDQNPLYGVLKNETDIQQYNLYGIKGVNTTSPDGSFVSNFGLKTELTNEFASMITIGAQAQDRVVGQDSTALSKWNFGLVDRLVPTKADSLFSRVKDKNKEFKELQALKRKLARLWAGYSIQSFQNDSIITNYEYLYFPWMPTDKFDSYVTLQKQFLSALIKYYTGIGNSNPTMMSNQIGMLPINLNLEIDGLSGIRIYDQINVDTRFLPAYYPNYLLFVIKGVSHSFNGNRWITKIDTIAQPKVGYFDPPNFVSLLKGNEKIDQSNTTTPPENDDVEDPAVVFNGLTKVGSKGTTPPTVQAFQAAGIANGSVPASLKGDLRDTDIPLSGVSQPFLFIDAYNSLVKLHEAAVAAGFKFTITSADRTLAKQKELKKNLGDKAATPGTSNHGWAIAIDIGELYQEVGGSTNAEKNKEGRKRSDLYKWLAANGGAYGWYNPWKLSDGGTDEMWHFNWYGTPTTQIPGLDYSNLPEGLNLTTPQDQYVIDQKRKLLEDANR